MASEQIQFYYSILKHHLICFCIILYFVSYTYCHCIFRRIVRYCILWKIGVFTPSVEAAIKHSSVHSSVQWRLEHSFVDEEQCKATPYHPTTLCDKRLPERYRQDKGHLSYRCIQISQRTPRPVQKVTFWGVFPKQAYSTQTSSSRIIVECKLWISLL